MALACLSVAPVHAADITHTKIGELDLITITGEIQPGDDARFRQLSVAYNKAVVALDSPGGSLYPALEIGKIIKINEHPTVVIDGSVCTSACALIWVAGSTKYLSPGGRVGFHASYKDEAGHKVETGLGNALVGHYLGLLNLPEKAVVFATAASPTEILWLDQSNMSKAGIDFQPFPTANSSPSAGPSRTVAHAPAPSRGLKWTPLQSAQSAPVQQAQAAPVTPISAPTMANAILRVGTEVPLRLEQELTTKGKQLRVGDRFHLTTSEPVMVEGVNVIPVGSPAVGEITDVRNKGMWGKSGHLSARILYVTVNGRQIRLSGAFDDKGVAGGVGAVAVSALVFLPAGFFMTGTSARIPAGSIIKSFVDEDVPLAMPAVAQGPLPVAAPATPLQVGSQH
jgi:hypothetical protein